jgi:hypothetical protein
VLRIRIALMRIQILLVTLMWIRFLLCHFGAVANPDPDPTFNFDPDPDPCYLIKAQNLEKVL